MNNLFELKTLLGSHRKILGASFLMGTLAAAGVSLTMKNVYTADAKLMAPVSQGSGLGGLLAGLAMDAGSPLKNPNDLYIGLLRSRIVTDKVIQQHDLQKSWAAGSMDDVRDRLSGAIKGVAGKDGLIRIEVTSTEPKEAALLANSLSEALMDAASTIGVTEASSRRKFLDRQVKQTQADLERAELSLRKVQERTGIMNIQLDMQADMATAVALEGRLAAQEASLASLMQYSADGNAQVLQAKAEIKALKDRVAKLRNPELSNLGEHGAEYLHAYREARTMEAKLTALTKFLEEAKLDEARTYAPLQWVDPAVEPTNKSGPKRSIITLFGGFLSLLGALAYIVLFRANAEQRPQGEAL